MKKKVVVLVVVLFVLTVLSACADKAKDVVPSEQIDVQALVFGERQETPPVELPERYIIFHKEFGTLYQFHLYMDGEKYCSSSEEYSDPRQWENKVQPFYISHENCPGLPVDLIISWDIQNHHAGTWKIFFQVGEGALHPAT